MQGLTHNEGSINLSFHLYYFQYAGLVDYLYFTEKNSPIIFLFLSFINMSLSPPGHIGPPVFWYLEWQRADQVAFISHTSQSAMAT